MVIEAICLTGLAIFFILYGNHRQGWKVVMDVPPSVLVFLIFNVYYSVVYLFPWTVLWKRRLHPTPQVT